MAILRYYKQLGLRDNVRYFLLVLCLYAVIFREPLEAAGHYAVSDIIDLAAAAGLPALLWMAVRKRSWRWPGVIGVVCLAVFVVSGMIGYSRLRYQTLSVTLDGLAPSISFFLWICLFAALFEGLPLERCAARLSFHVSGLSAVFVVLTFLDSWLHLWPRQIYRKGIGSIQIFYGHPSILAANAAILLVFLFLLIPYRKVPRVMAVLMAYPLFMTLRIRVWGFMAVAAMLALWTGVLKKRVKPLFVLAAGAAGLAVGWKRLYSFYFSPYAILMARGQFATNGLRIARDYFPFGTGFGTFGSRAAQAHYSPVYYWYHMYHTPGLDPLWPSYACDTFWPMILGETGWLGMAGYLGLMAILAYGIFAQQTKGAWAYTAAITAVVFELLDSTGNLAFADPSAAGFALALGVVFGMVAREVKRQTAALPTEDLDDADGPEDAPAGESETEGSAATLSGEAHA